MTDKLVFELDWIPVPHSIYMRKRNLTILSVQHQILYIFEVTSDFKFKKINEIGEDVVPLQERLTENDISDGSFTVLRQLFLKEIFLLHRQKDKIREFFKNVGFYRSLKMYRFQMIDDDNFLIRWTTPETFKFEMSSMPHPHAAIGPAIFTFFNWKKATIEGIYDLSSPQLVNIFESANESFRYGFLSKTIRPLTMDLVPDFKRNHENFKKNFKIKTGNDAEVNKKILNQLPISMPSALAFSPFLDPTFFTYDERIINSIERGRVPTDSNIK